MINKGVWKIVDREALLFIYIDWLMGGQVSNGIFVILHITLTSIQQATKVIDRYRFFFFLREKKDIDIDL